MNNIVSSYSCSSYSPEFEFDENQWINPWIKTKLIIEYLRNCGVLNIGGNIVGSLRPMTAQPLVPLIYSFECCQGEELDQLLWKPQFIYQPYNYKTEGFIVGKILRVIRNLILFQSSSPKIDRTSQCHNDLPLEGDIELDHEHTWKIVLNKNFSDETSVALLFFQSLDSFLCDHIYQLLSLYRLDYAGDTPEVKSRSLVRYYIYYPLLMNPQELIKTVSEYSKNCFPDLDLSRLYLIKEMTKDEIEIIFHFTEYSICLNFRKTHCYSPPTTEETTSILLNEMICGGYDPQSQKRGRAIIKIRHPIPERVLLNHLSGRLEIMRKSAPASCLDFLFSTHFYFSNKIGENYSKSFIKDSIRNNLENSFHFDQKKITIGTRYHHFYRFAEKKKSLLPHLSSASIDQGCYLIKFLIKELKKENLFGLHLEPSTQLRFNQFLFKFFQVLQKRTPANADEITFLIGLYLNELGWIQSYQEDPLFQILLDSLLIDLIPFSVLQSWLTVAAFRYCTFARIQFGDNAFFLIEKPVQMKLPADVHGALGTLIDYFKKESIQMDNFIKIYGFFSFNFQHFPRPSTLLYEETFLPLKQLIDIFIHHPNENISYIGRDIQLAIISNNFVA